MSIEEKRADQMQAGVEAGDIARKATLEKLATHDITVDKIGRRLLEALDATETKTHFNTEENRWEYSDPLISHSTRLQAVKIANTLLDIVPSSRHEVDLKTASFNVITSVPEPDLPPPENNNEEEGED